MNRVWMKKRKERILVGMHGSSQITEEKRTTDVWKGWLEGREVGDRQISFDGAIIGPESTLGMPEVPSVQIDFRTRDRSWFSAGYPYLLTDF